MTTLLGRLSLPGNLLEKLIQVSSACVLSDDMNVYPCCTPFCKELRFLPLTSADLSGLDNENRYFVLNHLGQLRNNITLCRFSFPFCVS